MIALLVLSQKDEKFIPSFADLRFSRKACVHFSTENCQKIQGGKFELLNIFCFLFNILVTLKKPNQGV